MDSIWEELQFSFSPDFLNFYRMELISVFTFEYIVKPIAFMKGDKECEI